MTRRQWEIVQQAMLTLSRDPSYHWCEYSPCPSQAELDRLVELLDPHGQYDESYKEEPKPAPLGVDEGGFRHRYPLECPNCQRKLTVGRSVTFTASYGPGKEMERISRLRRDGVLEDQDRLIAQGLHTGTSCRSCGEPLDDHEILEEANVKGETQTDA
jgi:hypothetical protein